jgi:hypothetical protein
MADFEATAATDTAFRDNPREFVVVAELDRLNRADPDAGIAGLAFFVNYINQRCFHGVNIGLPAVFLFNYRLEECVEELLYFFFVDLFMDHLVDFQDRSFGAMSEAALSVEPDMVQKVPVAKVIIDEFYKHLVSPGKTGASKANDYLFSWVFHDSVENSGFSNPTVTDNEYIMNLNRFAPKGTL